MTHCLSKRRAKFTADFEILDLVGDILLLVKPIEAHLITIRAGPALHADLTKAPPEQARAKGSATG